MKRAILTVLSYVFLHLIFFAHFSFSQANKFAFDHISNNKEFLNSASLLYQDSYGYIWIGLNGALARYDGIDFKLYTNDEDDSTSYSGFFINAIIEDFAGNLWIGTAENGLYKFSRETEKFINYRHDKNNPFSLSSDEIIGMCLDSKGSIWVISWFEHYLDRLNPETSLVERFNDKRINDDIRELGTVYIDTVFEMGFESSNLSSIAEDRHGRIWYALEGGRGLCQYNYKTDSLKLFRHNNNVPSSLQSDIVYSVIIDNNSDLWVGKISTK